MPRVRVDRAVLATALISLALVPASGVSVARAQDAASAREAYLAADFPGSAQAFEAVLASAGATREDALEAHRHLATLRFVLGDAVAAERHARAAIALAPDAVPVEGSPIELEPMFAAGRAALVGRGALRLEPGEPLGDVRTIGASVAPWPSALEGELSLACSAGPRAEGTWSARAPLPRVSLDVPALGADVACRAELAPIGGGSPWLSTEALVPGVTPREAPRGEERGGDDALVWGLAGGGAALAIAAAIVTVVLVTGADADARFGGSVSVPGW